MLNLWPSDMIVAQRQLKWLICAANIAFTLSKTIPLCYYILCSRISNYYSAIKSSLNCATKQFTHLLLLGPESLGRTASPHGVTGVTLRNEAPMHR